MRDRHYAPETALDDDRRINCRNETHSAETVRDRARGTTCRRVITPSSASRARGSGGGREVPELPARSDRDDGKTLCQADDYHRRAVALVARDSRLAVEEPPDLLAYCQKDLVGAGATCRERGDPPQRRLFPGEPGTRHGIGLRSVSGTLRRHGAEMIAPPRSAFTRPAPPSQVRRSAPAEKPGAYR